MRRYEIMFGGSMTAADALSWFSREHSRHRVGSHRPDLFASACVEGINLLFVPSASDLWHTSCSVPPCNDTSARPASSHETSPARTALGIDPADLRVRKGQPAASTWTAHWSLRVKRLGLGSYGYAQKGCGIAGIGWSANTVGRHRRPPPPVARKLIQQFPLNGNARTHACQCGAY